MTVPRFEVLATLTPCYRGPFPGFGFCRDHPDCRAKEAVRWADAERLALQRGTPVPPKSRRRCCLRGTP